MRLPPPKIPPRVEFENAANWQLPPRVLTPQHCIERAIQRCVSCRLDSLEKIEQHAADYQNSAIAAIVSAGDGPALFYAVAKRMTHRYEVIREARERRRQREREARAKHVSNYPVVVGGDYAS